MSKPWTNGLFDCFGDCSACIYSYCCPACAAGEIHKEGELGEWMVGCVLFCLLAACHPCIVTGPLRDRRGIEGSCIGDTCTWCFCAGCQLTRELREVRGN